MEIKSGKKIDSGMLTGLKYWKKNNSNSQGIIIYGGEKNEELSEGIQIIGWKDVTEV